MKQLIILSVIVLSFSTFTFGQNSNDILLNIAGEDISLEEFLQVYNKNNNNNIVEKNTIEEYLELYVNYKLIVKEAESLGLDTLSSYVAELDGYRKQLSQQYLRDPNVTEQLVEEAYQRKQLDIRASHILIKVDANASPGDTLKAYRTIMNIRQKAIDGEDFGELAVLYSEDNSARDNIASNGSIRKGNKGDLGYFTVLDLVYPFETMAYNTEVGEVSMPARTQFGYHLVYVADKKPALGKVHVAHIMISTAETSDEDAKKKADEIYQELLNKGDFAELAKSHSDDVSSAEKGGELRWFGVFRTHPNFINAIAALPDTGAFTQPIQTPNGWHIIKLLDRKEISSFEEAKGQLEMEVSKDKRSYKSKKAVIDRIKEENGFKEYQKNLRKFDDVVNDSIFIGKWSMQNSKTLNKKLYKLAGVTYSQQIFAQYLFNSQRMSDTLNIPIYINLKYKEFINRECINYEKSQLENKYPEFASIMKEYHDGILLFNLKQEQVWDKAVKDTTGLNEYFTENQKEYAWDTRYDAVIWSCNNENTATLLRDILNTNNLELTLEEIKDSLNISSQLNVSYQKDKYEIGKNNILNNIEITEAGLSENINIASRVIIVQTFNILNPELKELSECKGLVTADYQNYLEKLWIQNLRKKYPYTVNNEVLNKIK